MRVLKSCAFLWVCVGTVAVSAQTIPPLPPTQVCERFNDPAVNPVPLALADGDRLAILYTPVVDIQAGGIEFFFSSLVSGVPNPNGGIYSALFSAGVEIRDSAGSSVQPGTNILARGDYLFTLGRTVPTSNVWVRTDFATSVVLNGLQSYWIIFGPTLLGPPPVISPGGLGVAVGTDATGSDVALYTIDSGTGWGPVLPAAFMLRVTSPDCNPPGTGPAWTAAGAACAAGVNAPRLLGADVPAIGAIASLRIDAGLPGAPWTLFLAADAAATPLPLGSGCSMWLELTSFFSLVSLGVNPLVSGTLDGTGSAVIPLPVPETLSLVGGRLAFQAGVGAANPLGLVATEVQVGTIGF